MASCTKVPDIRHRSLVNHSHAEDRIALELALAESAEVQSANEEQDRPKKQPRLGFQMAASIFGPSGHVLSFLLASGASDRANLFLAHLGPWWGCKQLRHTSRMMSELINMDRRKSAMTQVTREPELRWDKDGREYSWDQFEQYYSYRYKLESIKAHWNKSLPAEKEQLWLETQRSKHVRAELTGDSAGLVFGWVLFSEEPDSKRWLVQLLADLDVQVEAALAHNLYRWCSRLDQRVLERIVEHVAKRYPAVLRIAAQTNMLSIAQHMLAAKADPDVRAGPHGRTPLMLAMAGGHVHMCSTLLDFGANPQLLDAYGKKADLLCGSKRTKNKLKLVMLLPTKVRLSLRNVVSTGEKITWTVWSCRRRFQCVRYKLAIHAFRRRGPCSLVELAVLVFILVLVLLEV
eukprot:TRINITY_DN64699_c0_g1_i1.p1 TRINITY_DN64699_c0_g1~~TRINITY_DN64699_c0_g1_i1.p1  ORF type:complete len:420 (+),score=49.21 TRINITY_DN64699_c0_g1_i1:50-1261(+)